MPEYTSLPPLNISLIISSDLASSPLDFPGQPESSFLTFMAISTSSRLNRCLTENRESHMTMQSARNGHVSYFADQRSVRNKSKHHCRRLFPFRDRDVLILYISKESQDDCLHVDFECFKLALWPTLRQKFMNFLNFLLVQAINMTKRSAISHR